MSTWAGSTTNVSARSKARKRALDVLFEADQRGADIHTVLEERLRESGRQTPLPEYAIQIVRGVAEHRYQLDAQIASASPEWPLHRMPAVDRALLRIGLWEIVHSADVPGPVAIDEAKALAADLSTDDSARFVGGVLGSFVSDASPTEHDATQ